MTDRADFTGPDPDAARALRGLAEVATKAVYTHGFGFREVVGPAVTRDGRCYVNLCWDDDTMVRAVFWVDDGQE